MMRRLPIVAHRVSPFPFRSRIPNHPLTRSSSQNEPKNRRVPTSLLRIASLPTPRGEDGSGFEDDESSKGLEKNVDEDPSISVDLHLPRRSLLVSFTCNRCGARTERLVNPVAWQQGMVMCQCQGCQAWHKLQDAGNLIEEIRFDTSDDE